MQRVKIYRVMSAKGGIAAYYFGVNAAGSIHADLMKVVLWVVVAVHVLGALVQHFCFRTDVLRQMTTG